MTDTDTRAAWLEWRRQGIGASEIAAVCGRSEWDSPLSVYLRKRGDIPDDYPPSEAMRLGLRLEDFVADEFTERTGLHVIEQQRQCVHSDAMPWARCTLDGLAVESPNATADDALGVFEAKTTGDLDRFDPLPEHVAMQVQWQLFVTGLAHAWVVVFGGGFRLGVRVLPVQRDDDRIAEMVKTAREFWQCVQDGTPPPVYGYAPGDAAALAAAYPEPEPGTVVELGDEGAELLEQLRAARDAATALEHRITEAENGLKALVGNAEAGAVDGDIAFTWKAVSTTRVDTKRLKADDPDLAARYSSTTTHRRFLLR